MPATRFDIAVIDHQMTDQRQRHRERVRRHLADAVVRRVGHPHAVAATRFGIDRVESRAVAAHQSDTRQRRQHAIGDRSVLKQQRIALACGGDQIVFAAALGVDVLNTARAKHFALELDVGEVVVGDQCAQS